MTATIDDVADVADVLAPAPQLRALSVRRRGDRIFFGGATVSGLIVLSIMVAVGLFLSIAATQALVKTGASFLTTAKWQPDRGKFGIAAVLLGTVLIAFVAVAIALPVSMGMALFITEVAPNWLRASLLHWLTSWPPCSVGGLWPLGSVSPRGPSRWRVQMAQHVDGVGACLSRRGCRVVGSSRGGRCSCVHGIQRVASLPPRSGNR